ncbi:MAG: hypothetical protein WBW44_01605 [Solirubrobacterales bacterium]
MFIDPLNGRRKMTIDHKRLNGQAKNGQAELNDLLAELELRTKAVNDTLAANMSDTAYLQALRGVQNTATRVVETNRAQ